MSTHIVDDEFALPAPDGLNGRLFEYLRLKFEPTLLIHSKTGDLYRRRDGMPWEWPAYKITTNFDTKRVDREPWTACDDSRRFRDTDRFVEVEHRGAKRHV